MNIRWKSDQILSENVSFCGERPLDFNFVDLGGPRSSVGEFLGAEGGGGTGPGQVRSWVGEAPGQAYKS